MTLGQLLNSANFNTRLFIITLVNEQPKVQTFDSSKNIPKELLDHECDDEYRVCEDGYEIWVR